jgi:DNA (cytosine-5)-methyltransferase 1
MSRPRLLDLFCGAGGAAMGYYRAGFDVVGVDIEPQPKYPFEFHREDALMVGPNFGRFDAIHASPPCQHASTVTPIDARQRHARLIEPTRQLLEATGLPYVIENVVGSALRSPVRLCGSSFGMDLRRHRLFESNVPLAVPPCDHGWQRPRFRSLDGRMVARGQLASVVGVHGNINYSGEFELRCKAMGIDWMTNAELTQAIPPAFTEHIGSYLLSEVLRRAQEAA